MDPNHGNSPNGKKATTSVPEKMERKILEATLEDHIRNADIKERGHTKNVSHAPQGI